MTMLNQKTKDRLAIIGILALEVLFIFGAASNFYRYIILGVTLDIFLAVPSTVGTAILTAYLVVFLVSYLDKKRLLKSFQK